MWTYYCIKMLSDRTVDVQVLNDGCIVQITKCGDCANMPVIKDICSQQK